MKGVGDRVDEIQAMPEKEEPNCVFIDILQHNVSTLIKN